MRRKVEFTSYYGNQPDDKSWLRPWELLRDGDTEQALQEMGEMYRRELGTSELISYGVMMLYVGMYEEAYEHFFKETKRLPSHREGDYTDAGVALWCMDYPSGATQIWKKGLKANYAVNGLCIETPTLLMMASILEPESIARSEAESALAAKISDPKADRWPGTLSQYLVGMRDIESVEASSLTQRGPRDGPEVLDICRWSIDFYMELVRIGKGGYRVEDFRQSMKAILKAIAPRLKDPDFLADLLRQPEFFIARHAAKQATEVGLDLGTPQ